uniref:Uncharacterized protein n=1 Tax=Arundo donax TaxID=35708 RepID=A0A0A8Y4L7_ARUDO
MTAADTIYWTATTCPLFMHACREICKQVGQKLEQRSQLSSPLQRHHQGIEEMAQRERERVL